MSNNYKDVKNFRQRQKNRIVYVMGSKCSICGYDKCITALELHHLNPLEKEFTFSANTNRAWEHIEKELPKTILVCANCHREIHQDLIDTDTLTTSFDEQRNEEVKQKIENQKTKTVNLCKQCGKPITNQATYCEKCYAESRRMTARPTREQLKEEIRNMSMVKVGEKYGVSDNAIRKWCKSYNLPHKKTEINNYSDTDWERI